MNNIYQIKICYRTGDSFGSRDEDGVLEMEWMNLDNAKAALKRIEEHWRWYEQTEKYPWSDKVFEEPVWHKGEKSAETVKLKLDNGNEVSFWPFWCGYFERLQSAEIILSTKDMRIEF